MILILWQLISVPNYCSCILVLLKSPLVLWLQFCQGLFLLLSAVVWSLLNWSCILFCWLILICCFSQYLLTHPLTFKLLFQGILAQHWIYFVSNLSKLLVTWVIRGLQTEGGMVKKAFRLLYILLLMAYQIVLLQSRQGYLDGHCSVIQRGKLGHQGSNILEDSGQNLMVR